MLCVVCSVVRRDVSAGGCSRWDRTRTDRTTDRTTERGQRRSMQVRRHGDAACAPSLSISLHTVPCSAQLGAALLLGNRIGAYTTRLNAPSFSSSADPMVSARRLIPACQAIARRNAPGVLGGGCAGLRTVGFFMRAWFSGSRGLFWAIFGVGGWGGMGVGR